jgi:hypothetical protein
MSSRQSAALKIASAWGCPAARAATSAPVRPAADSSKSSGTLRTSDACGAPVAFDPALAAVPRGLRCAEQVVNSGFFVVGGARAGEMEIQLVVLALVDADGSGFEL